ncbi:MAG: hypothetical protein IJ751_05895, partial [Oscillospiraceae bacterium]|nr:hypothetical protein [Oscillospiraceae bacterium]
MIEATIYFERYLAWKKRVSATAGQQGGLCYESYTAMEPDMLQHDADMGNPAALEELGERYLFGVSPFPRDIDQAQSLLAEAAQGGHPDAAALLAELCRTDQFGRRDPARYPALLE